MVSSCSLLIRAAFFRTKKRATARRVPFGAALYACLVAALAAPSLQSQIIIIRRTEEVPDAWDNSVQGRSLPAGPSSWAQPGWNHPGFVVRRVQPWYAGPVPGGAGGGGGWRPLWIPLDGRPVWRPHRPTPSSTPAPPSPPPPPPPPPAPEEPKPTAESNQQEPSAKQAVSTEGPKTSSEAPGNVKEP
ncbi:hypothetical protein V5799_015129 [Amblyomma americanum]|uniref:Uncharacterized protein n=1 Tax=Amblyomma americanum TaxID=6943 RepID=A0AAQ4E119_AMBAM